MVTLDEALDRIGLGDGMTLSFHHHFRNGDRVTNAVMAAVARRGVKDLHLAASGLFACHDPLASLIEEGVVTKLTLSTISKGRIADAITMGKLQKPAVLMTHGGRVRAIEAGDLHIDVAFIAAPACDEAGNANGRGGAARCGVLSYAYADARYADWVVLVTDHLEPYPVFPAEIDQADVDFVVVLDEIGDPDGISFGPTKITEDPDKLQIARAAAEAVEAAGYLREGMSLQTGAGGISLAVAQELGRRMRERGITGGFASGGITAPLVRMLEERLFRALLDVQCFDRTAIDSIGKNSDHVPMSASRYANPNAKGCVVDRLDVMILGATEVDVAFNVNVITGSDGAILSASGGNADCAAGAKLAVVVTKLVKGPYCVVRNAVTTVATPGETIDLLVTDRGVAVNPRRRDLSQSLRAHGIEPVDIEDLKRLGEREAGAQKKPRLGRRIVAVVEYRDGTVLDVVRQIDTEPEKEEHAI